MKNFSLTIIALSVIGLGFYFLNSKSASTLPMEPKFFSANEILPADIVVKITSSGFTPAEISVQKGQRVVFVNESSGWAWPASDPHPIHTDYSPFDPKEPLKVGEAWAFIFDREGIWKYHDHLDPAKRGIVNVSETTPLISPEQVEKLINNGAPVLGDRNAKVAIIEFADFECPFCKKYYETILLEIKKQFLDTGKAKFVFVNFAILGQGSLSAASAARCAHDQNKFWEYHDFLFEHQKEGGRGFDIKFLEDAAKELKLDSAIFNSCLRNNKYTNKVKEETNFGRSIGIAGTPTTFVGNSQVLGSQGVAYLLDKIKQEIEAN